MSQESLSPESVPRVDGMPRFGLGTWQNENPEQCVASVSTALEMGYRHVDTAQIYGNEDAVGDGIAAADVPREEVFLATKVWIDHLDRDGVVETTEESVAKLGVDRLDMLYVHWPSRTYEAAETLPALEELKERGLVDRIGVSNFEPHHLDEARDVLDEPPFANQVEMHPLLQQTELREYVEGTDIELVAYSPLARGGVFDVPELSDIAEKHGVSEAQVSLAWLREKGVTAIPKATSEAHIRDNWESLALELDDEDVSTIDAIDRTERQINPGFGPAAWD
ncbi:aldo/keto reductase [Halosimplex salinum]|uniref:aldo/keto reductase n=1 Tax=Halosimplex salinum TaxID=1710538 RepID=UPI000F48696D|nr:aldo/keto reductase [Halosimplex salinum]